MAVRVLVGDPSDLILLGMRQVLEDDYRLEVVEVAGDWTELLRQAAALQPDVIVSGDLYFGVSILTLLEQLQQAAPEARLVLVGDARNGHYMQHLLRLGVQGYLYRGDGLRDLLPLVVWSALRQRPYLSPTASTEFLVSLQSSGRRWTPDAEARAVLRLLAQGTPVGSIAAELAIPLRRVYWVRQKLRRHFGANTNEHLISIAASEGFRHAGE